MNLKNHAPGLWRLALEQRRIKSLRREPPRAYRKSDGVRIIETLSASFVFIPDECWRPIRHPLLVDRSYEVSNIGRVRSVANDGTKKHVQPKLNGSGYPSFQIFGQRKHGGSFNRHFMVHVAVAKAFVPGERRGLQVHHMDENKIDARAERLLWVTPRQNILLSKMHRKHRGVWTPDDIRKMRAMKKLGFKACEICKVFPVLPFYLSKILSGARGKSS